MFCLAKSRSRGAKNGEIVRRKWNIARVAVKKQINGAIVFSKMIIVFTM